MRLVDSYNFGEIVVDGRRYFRDLILSPDNVKSGWWRREGHKLSVEDLEDALKEKPEILVVGTGYVGLMKVPKEVRDHVKSLGIELIVQRTQEACRTYNRLVQSGRRIVAALHLTC